MRDYVVRHKKTGVVLPVTELSDGFVRACLRQAERTRQRPSINPGITVEAFIERLKLELFIRETGLRD